MFTEEKWGDWMLSITLFLLVLAFLIFLAVPAKAQTVIAWGDSAARGYGQAVQDTGVTECPLYNHAINGSAWHKWRDGTNAGIYWAGEPFYKFLDVIEHSSGPVLVIMTNGLLDRQLGASDDTIRGFWASVVFQMQRVRPDVMIAHMPYGTGVDRELGWRRGLAKRMRDRGVDMTRYRYLHMPRLERLFDGGLDGIHLEPKHYAMSVEYLWSATAAAGWGCH
jgi:hypothetical protein